MKRRRRRHSYEKLAKFCRKREREKGRERVALALSLALDLVSFFWLLLALNIGKRERERRAATSLINFIKKEKIKLLASTLKCCAQIERLSTRRKWQRRKSETKTRRRMKEEKEEEERERERQIFERKTADDVLA